MIRAPALLLSTLVAVSGAGAQDGFDVDGLDLAGLIACEAVLPHYGALAFSLSTEPDVLSRLGWREIETENPYIRQFEIAAPLDVFGHRTSEVAFSATGVLALLRGVDPATLSAQLQTVRINGASGQFHSERIVFEDVEEDPDVALTFATKVSLNVSTIETHPGIVFAGCSYRTEIR